MDVSGNIESFSVDYGEDTGAIRQNLRRELGLLSEKDLAVMLDLQVETIEAWRKADKGPDFVRLGRKIFYQRQAIAEWIRANTVLQKRNMD